MKKKNLKGMLLPELLEFVESLGEKKYRAKQLYQWLYAKGAQTLEEMTDISKEFRSTLQQSAQISNLVCKVKSTSSDGTQKFLFTLEDGLAIESVMIPGSTSAVAKDNRLTLCLSTQVGCPLDCKFCATGTMGFKRNLTTGEIIDQLLQAQKHSTQRITNLVYMGMGEPLLNYDNVIRSIDIINDDNGMNIGARRITVSTAGYADQIRRIADDERQIKLALSLHSVNNEKRAQLMPITKKYPVSELIEALGYYYGKTRRRPTLEYIMFDGFNDTHEDAKGLVNLCNRIPCKINLIPFHSIEFTHPSEFAASLRPTPAERIEKFANALRKAEVTVMVRGSAGKDINAACGQLAVANS